MVSCWRRTYILYARLQYLLGKAKYEQQAQSSGNATARRQHLVESHESADEDYGNDEVEETPRTQHRKPSIVKLDLLLDPDWDEPAPHSPLHRPAGSHSTGGGAADHDDRDAYENPGGYSDNEYDLNPYGDDGGYSDDYDPFEDEGEGVFGSNEGNLLPDHGGVTVPAPVLPQADSVPQEELV